MDNITYIEQWFLSHNRFLPEDEKKEDILKILVLFGIVFEKLDDRNNDDNIILQDGSVTYRAGSVKESDRIHFLLNVVNARYGYLSYEELLQETLYDEMINGDNGVVPYEDLVASCKVFFDNVLEEFKGYDFNRIVYRVKGKVFFCDDELSEKEMLRLNAYWRDSQKLFEVNRCDDGSLMIW